MVFELLIDYRTHNDIEDAIDYYLEKNANAAVDFYNDIQDAYSALKKNPFYQIRYLDYRCLPLRIFPFMFRFTINERKKVVYIHALINTSKSPNKNWLKVKR